MNVMSMCEPHWKELRHALRVKGLGDFIAPSAEEAMKMLGALAKDGVSLKNFDPMMAAHNAICMRALGCGGLEIFEGAPDGQICPLCEAEKHGGLNWIESAVDSVAKFVKTLPNPRAQEA